MCLDSGAASLIRSNSVGKQLQADRERGREREQQQSEKVWQITVHSCITTYTVLHGSHVFSQQEAELSMHSAFGNEFISVVNTVECFSSHSSLAHSLSLSLSLPLPLCIIFVSATVSC